MGMQTLSVVAVTAAGVGSGGAGLEKRALQGVKSRMVVAKERKAFEGHLERIEQLGLQTNPTDLERVLDHFLYDGLCAFLAEQGIPTYDPQKVKSRLDRKAKELGNNWRWVWRPLRAIGADEYYQDTGMGGRVLSVVYDRCALIPAAVLYTFERIRDGFPAARFFVSDFEKVRDPMLEHTSRPDPFLAVAVPRTPFLVVEFWDEPGFTP